MKKWNYIPILLILCNLSCFTQLIKAVDNLRFTDIRSFGLGGNNVTQSAFSNPALLPLLNNKQLQVDYFNAYGLKSLGTLHAGFYHPVKLLSYGIDVSTFGYADYRISNIRSSLGKQLTDNLYIGLSFQLNILQTILIENNPTQLSTDFGLLYKPMDNLLIGMLIMNFPNFYISGKDSDIEDFNKFIIQTGFQWQVINSMFIIGTIQTTSAELWNGQLGLEYIPFDSFAIRVGCRIYPFEPTFGAGYKFSQFQLDVAASYHKLLGISPGIGLRYFF